jgi:glycosyltransferase involved in cell wall biosynthesis
MYLHQLLKYLQTKGHEVRVLLLNARHYGVTRCYTWDGIDVYPNDRDVITNCLEWSTTLMTHLDYTELVMGYGSVYKKPVIHLVHNDHRRPSIQDHDLAQYIIYNSTTARDKVNYGHLGTVLHPPCDWRRYDTGQDQSKAEHITLINLDHNKGGHILRQIAAALPGRQFIGVVGSYSEPIAIGQHIHQPTNVRVLPKTPDILGIYRQTRVLIMPSKYESWGRTATEAMASGIPVISTGGPGLRENCGKAGIYIEDRDDIQAWVEAIRRLDNPASYKQKSAACKKRSRELDPSSELEATAQWIVQNVRFNQRLKRAAVSTAATL